MTSPNRRSAPIAPSVRDLREARDFLRTDRCGPGEVVAVAIDAILAGADPNRALGLRGHAGQRSALMLDRLRERNRLICGLAQRHFGALSLSDQAREVVAAASAYWRRAARLDTGLASMPASYAGTPREFLFQIARLPSEMPSVRTVRAILSSERRHIG